MQRTLRLCIIADDLTSATDGATPFVDFGHVSDILRAPSTSSRSSALPGVGSPSAIAMKAGGSGSPASLLAAVPTLLEWAESADV